MDHSATFARHFARLVLLLRQETSSVDEQKMLLRVLVTLSKQGAVALRAERGDLRANDDRVPGALAGVGDVVAQLKAHAVRQIAFSEGTKAADLLGAARIIAAAPSANGGADVIEKLGGLSGKSVSAEPVEPGRAKTPSGKTKAEEHAPAAEPAAASEERAADTPKRGRLSMAEAMRAPPKVDKAKTPGKARRQKKDTPASESKPAREERSATADVKPAREAKSGASEIKPTRESKSGVSEIKPARESKSGVSEVKPRERRSGASPAMEAPAARSEEKAPAASASVAAEAAAVITQITARDVSKLEAAALFTALDEAKNAAARTAVLDDLAALAEYTARRGKTAVVAEVLHGLVTREEKVRGDEPRRAFATTFRRLAKPAVLRGIATLVAKRSAGKREQQVAVLRRAGEEGADAVVDLIGQAPTQEERTVLFQLLKELPDAEASLTRMLGDSRWFVARNAADLLGELSATRAESALIGALQHADDRVRRAATGALLKLGTPDAVRAAHDAVSDASPEVRMQAAAAIANKKDGRTAITLIRAIDEEPDSEVQVAMIHALGKVATSEAVAKLVKMAEPEGRLFRKKTTLFRVAAVQALGEARTPAALAALQELADDKEREVREMVARALAQASR